MSERRPTMREIAEAARHEAVEPRQRDAVRPGAFNLAGTLFDPSGAPLVKRGTLTPAEARRAVEGGALLAFEGCGCGGWAGCAPEWVEAEARSDAAQFGDPAFVKGFGSPTWIDRWSGPDGDVVFLHGDVRWGPIGV